MSFERIHPTKGRKVRSQGVAARPEPSSVSTPTQKQPVTPPAEHARHKFADIPIGPPNTPRSSTDVSRGHFASRIHKNEMATLETQGDDLALKKDWPPAERKEGAKTKLISLIRAKMSIGKEELESALLGLKTEFQLSAAKLEGDQYNPKIGFYASSANFLPLSKAIISGAKAGVVLRQSIVFKDYIKATRYDGPFPTPGDEVAKALSTRFPTLLVPVLPVVTLRNNRQYRRAGKVEAESSVARGTGRSGTGETVFGHFGADEEKIITGKNTTKYNGGHLVGDQLMDSRFAFNLYEDWNLAPQQRNFNSPVYVGVIENAVTKAIKGGARVKYSVRVQYPDVNGRYRIKPSKLAANLPAPPYNNYWNDVVNAIKKYKNLDDPIELTRRTPGFWQAKAEVMPVGAPGHTISSGRVRARQDVVFENNPANVEAKIDYEPKGHEQVRYALETDAVVIAPTNKVPLSFAKATKVMVTARQKTFST
jgi:hypothetical protein